jgi:hypothetical protein
MYLKIKLLIVMLLFGAGTIVAQVSPASKDSVKEKQDKMYRKIEKFSKKKKFTKFLHKLIFKPVKAKEPSRERKHIKKKTPELQNTYEKYEGKVIRTITIETLDPFGYSVNDTTKKPDNWLENFGNSVHLKSKQMTIRNLLLFKKHEKLDSLLVKESERLIRSQRYIRRVAIKPLPVGTSNDSVDLYIRVLDSWSLIPNGSASGSGTSFEITERNFFGLGHEFRNEFDKRFNTGQTSYLARYRVPNIVNTYIDGEINYEIWRGDNSQKSFSLQRQFFSAYTRWAGGVYFEEKLVRDSLPDNENVYAMQNYKTEAQDYWAGYSFKIFKGFTEEDRTTNLVTTGRFYNQVYKESPSAVYDSINFYSDQRLYLTSVGITSRKFVQDKFLFNYDIVEDIPIGKVYSATFGIQDKNNEHRFYLGARYGFGNYYKWGYLSTNAEVGSFFYNNNRYQSVFKLDMLYFTNILEWGEWRFRHFIKPLLVFGDNRMPIITDQLNLNGDNGIQGFFSREVLGTRKLLLTLQTQSYSPWNLSGFRINPFINFTMGVIGDHNHPIYQSNLYTKVGIGILLYNDYLVFNSFQLSIAFYPNIPGQGNNVFKTNTFKNTDIALPDFQVGKPVVVPYQ